MRPGSEEREAGAGSSSPGGTNWLCLQCSEAGEAACAGPGSSTGQQPGADPWPFLPVPGDRADRAFTPAPKASYFRQ